MSVLPLTQCLYHCPYHCDQYYSETEVSLIRHHSIQQLKICETSRSYVMIHLSFKKCRKVIRQSHSLVYTIADLYIRNLYLTSVIRFLCLELELNFLSLLLLYQVIGGVTAPAILPPDRHAVLLCEVLHGVDAQDGFLSTGSIWVQLSVPGGGGGGN